MVPPKIKVCEMGFWLGSGGRPAGCDGGRPAGRSSAAPMSSAAPKKKAFDRGGPVGPPRSNAADAPSQKTRGLGGSALQPKPNNHFVLFSKKIMFLKKK